MFKKILKMNGARPLDKNKQKNILGGGGCRRCYSANGGAYNSADPNCSGCSLPEPV